jgi:hypothetical protein
VIFRLLPKVFNVNAAIGINALVTGYKYAFCLRLRRRNILAKVPQGSADIGGKRRTDSISKFWIIKMTFPIVQYLLFSYLLFGLPKNRCVGKLELAHRNISEDDTRKVRANRMASNVQLGVERAHRLAFYSHFCILENSANVFNALVTKQFSYLFVKHISQQLK